MNRLLLVFAAVVFSLNLSGQNFIATTQADDSIKGLCDTSGTLYVLFPFKGQVEAECSLSKLQISNRLTNKVQFLKDKPKYKDEGMVRLIINCKGELVNCAIDNKTKSLDLDAQIISIFKNLGTWRAGIYNNDYVDSSLLFSFKIKKGKVTVN